MVNREALGLIGAGGEEEKFCRQHLELYSSGFSGHRFSRGYHPGDLQSRICRLCALVVNGDFSLPKGRSVTQ